MVVLKTIEGSRYIGFGLATLQREWTPNNFEGPPTKNSTRNKVNVLQLRMDSLFLQKQV